MSLAAVLVGLVITFFAQATATGFVAHAATADRAAASGLYITSYFRGGLVGRAVSGQMFDHFGWPAPVATVTLSLAAAMVLATALRIRR